MVDEFVDSMKSEKVLTLLLIGTILISVVIIIPTLLRYTELTETYEHQSFEFDELKASTAVVEEKLETLNNTFSLLSCTPSVRATNIIIERVGFEYFNEYYHDPVVEINPRLNDTIIVRFKYDTSIGDYSKEHEVVFYFGENKTYYYGLPVEENLQPFNVTGEKAKSLAIQGGLPVSQYPLDASFVYMWIEDVYPTKGYGEKYVWFIESWDDPPWANPRKRHSAYVDPCTGQVYSINPGGNTVQEEEVDTPEKAYSYGIGGYIKLHYSELPQKIILGGGENITFTIQATFISYADDLKKAILHVDPSHNDTYWIHSNFSDKLRGYLIYEPSGVFTLESGGTLNITCTLEVPTTEIELAFNRHTLHALGIESENILVVHDLHT